MTSTATVLASGKSTLPMRSPKDVPRAKSLLRMASRPFLPTQMKLTTMPSAVRSRASRSPSAMMPALKPPHSPLSEVTRMMQQRFFSSCSVSRG